MNNMFCNSGYVYIGSLSVTLDHFHIDCLKQINSQHSTHKYVWDGKIASINKLNVLRKKCVKNVWIS